MSELEQDETLRSLDHEYEYGFKDDVKPVYTTGEGLSEAVVRQISAAKHEPDWMLDFPAAAHAQVWAGPVSHRL